MQVEDVTKRAPGGEGKPSRARHRRVPQHHHRARRAVLAVGIGVATLLTAHSATAVGSDGQDGPTLADEARELQAGSPLRQESGMDEDELLRLRAQATNASAQQARAALPGCTGAAPTRDYENGHLPPEAMCALPWVTEGGQLRADAAVAFARMNADYAATFGSDLCVGDTYRDFQYQADVKSRRGGFAAPAGASTHGWGLAVDLCSESADPGGPQWAWLDQNAPKFGFENPEWAREGGSGPYEPWHWEFASAVAVEKAKRAETSGVPAPARTTGRS